MMTLAICLTTVLFLPIIWAFASVPHRLGQFSKIDLATPRVQAAQLKGAGHRTVAAQQNAWEALLMFVAAIGLAVVSGVPFAALSVPATVFVVARSLHGIFYVLDKPPLRTLSFVVGIASIIWIVFLAYQYL